MHKLLYSFPIERLHRDKAFQIYFYVFLLNNLCPAKCHNNVRYFEMNYKFKHIKAGFGI